MKSINKREILLFISGILNSKLYQQNYKGNNNTGTKIKNLDIVKINFHEPDQVLFFKIISEQVDQILTTKEANPQAETSALEAKLDLLVYKLYELIYEEVKIVDPEFTLSQDEYENLEVE